MKKIFFLIIVLFLIDSISAQHKTMTIYYSGGTTDVVNLSGTDSIVIFICGASKVNYGGKHYNTVLIGNQCWLKENLDIGTMVQGSSNQLDNGILEKYCYNNDPNNCNTYGGLYQWNEAMKYVTTIGTQGICPPGWHIPTLAEFQILSSTVGGVGNGNALKAIGQGGGEGAGTNTSGFSALLAGYRLNNGNFNQLGFDTYFRCSTEYNSTNAYYLELYYNFNYIFLNFHEKDYGYSVRCLKD